MPSPGPPDCLWRKMTPRLTAAAMAICTRIFQLIRITIPALIPPLSTMLDLFGLGKSDVRSTTDTPVRGGFSVALASGSGILPVLVVAITSPWK